MTVKISHFKELMRYSSNKVPPYSKNDLIKQMKMEDDIASFEKIVSQLLSEDLLKVDENYKNKESEELPESEDYIVQYYFEFVGMLRIMNRTLIVYPKYVKNVEFDTKHGYKKFEQLMRVILYYEKSKFRILDFDESVKNESAELLGISMKIIEQYEKYGLYTVERIESISNGNGEVDWERTINETTLLYSNQVPIYILPYTRNIIDEKTVIQQIHVAILADINRNLNTTLQLLDNVEAGEFQGVLEEVGDFETLIYYLKKELENQFVIHKIETIEYLLAYIKVKMKIKDSDIKIVGVRRFEHVWEDVCKIVYNNDLDKSLIEVGLSSREYSGNIKLKNIVEIPEWIYIENNEKYHSNTPLRLDCLHVNEISSVFEIYDAKYMTPVFKNEKIYNEPSGKEITKQYLYELSFKKIAATNGYSISNTFIVPEDELEDDKGKGELIAEVSIKIYRDLGLGKIKMISRDAERIFEEYLNNKRI